MMEFMVLRKDKGTEEFALPLFGSSPSLLCLPDLYEDIVNASNVWEGKGNIGDDLGVFSLKQVGPEKKNFICIFRTLKECLGKVIDTFTNILYCKMLLFLLSDAVGVFLVLKLSYNKFLSQICSCQSPRFESHILTFYYLLCTKVKCTAIIFLF